ncbi:isocitrate lyase/PEP mutase family protein [Haloplanus pelagicus]|jgi:methylisocitrate lyase|uniref:isocitrate lyase/PEP mutase family protein n=1 Tax=Haloplanus pelagicus TaxID=2949995 RepID=UPI0020420232|nr:isocitrate lyase/PEP mutase family protein [Haloplanus sp. HW8-1]
MDDTARRERLRELIEREEVAYLAGVHDSLSTKIACEYADVDAVQQSGYGTAASLLGYPDLNFTSLKETVDVVHSMVRAAGETPVVVDGDTGYGGVVNLPHTISEIERTGAAGVFIEDQATPKKCGLLEGKELIDADTMADKLAAAIEARSDDEFVVMARTDAYETEGIDDVVRRGNRYAEAGADVFMLGEVAPLEDLSTIAAGVDAPFYALGVEMDHDEFETWHPVAAYDEAGVSLVSDVAGMLQASIPAMQAYMDSMTKDGDHDEDLLPLNQVSSLLGVEEYEAFEATFGG